MTVTDEVKGPRHVAFIMDGNGRWARERGLPRTAGHRQGVKRVKEILKSAGRLGISYVTFFAFSTENWTRPRGEIQVLMRYLESFLAREIKELHRNNVRFRVIGRHDPIPPRIIAQIRKAEELTRHNSGLTCILALNYGARQEIVDAARAFAAAVEAKEAAVQDLDEERFSGYLNTKGIPDPDLLVRTSGEMRISNFLLWQLSYTELYFPSLYWPDFDEAAFTEALQVYRQRDRRFGAVGGK